MSCQAQECAMGVGGSGCLLIAVVDFVWEHVMCMMAEILMVHKNCVANIFLCGA